MTIQSQWKKDLTWE